MHKCIPVDLVDFDRKAAWSRNLSRALNEFEISMKLERFSGISIVFNVEFMKFLALLVENSENYCEILKLVGKIKTFLRSPPTTTISFWYLPFCGDAA